MAKTSSGKTFFLNWCLYLFVHLGHYTLQEEVSRRLSCDKCYDLVCEAACVYCGNPGVICEGLTHLRF